MNSMKNDFSYFIHMILFFSCITFWGCATSPTGRSQLMLVPQGQVNQMGAESFQEIKKKTPIEKNANITQYVKCITDALIVHNADRIPQSNWELVVFRSNQINAFALPGQKIGVYTGMFPVAKNPAQLAAVIGHEIGHVLAEHGRERVSTAVASQGLMLGAGLATQNNENQGLIMAAIGAGAQFGVLLPHSRTHEKEADKIGLQLMAKAGFNPEEAAVLWQNMGAASGGKQPPEWTSTHPSNETRIREIRAALPSVMPDYQKAVATNAAGAQCPSLKM